MGPRLTWSCQSEVERSAEGGRSRSERWLRPHVPGTRLVHSCVQLEGFLKVVETDHLLVERVQFNATPVAGEA